MKKFLAAILMTVASVAAQAQSNVTIYGVADLSQGYVKSSGAKNAAGVSDDTLNQGLVPRLDNNFSYLGFKGTEDLGNGLKAIFQFETNLSADNGAGFSTSRDTYVGLESTMGKLVFGNLTTPIRAYGAKAEIVPGASGIGTITSLVGQIGNTHTGADNRAKNAVAYTSPSFNGFTGTVAFVNGENRTNDRVVSGTKVEGINQRGYQIAGQYDANNVFAGLGYHKQSDSTGVNNTDSTIIRAVSTYTFPTKTKLMALYDITKVDGVKNDTKRTAWAIGVSQEINKHLAGLQYARANNTEIGGVKQNETGANMWTAMYGYNLSKRTMLHARYTRLDNEDAGRYNYYLNPVGGTNGGGVDQTNAYGATYTGFTAGIRHSF